VVAHANEFAFSAAYWLAAAAGELYVPKTGMVGSVGVIMLHVDQSRMNEKRGLDVTHIIAGARKADFSPHQPLSDAALGNAQAMVDRLYGQFVKDVAQSRRISQKAVRETEAALLNPDQASANGMIDGVETLDGALQRLNVLMSDLKKRRSYGRAAAIAQLPEEHDMSTAANGAAPVPAVITQEQLDAAKAAGIAEGKATATADAQALAATAAQARISGILTHTEAAGRRTLAEHIAFKTTQSVEEAAAMLAAAPKEAATQPTNLLAAAMGKIENPKVGADAGEGEAKKVTPPVAAEIYAFRRECVAKARNGKAA
jgi:hypothetical protein